MRLDAQPDALVPQVGVGVRRREACGAAEEAVGDVHDGAHAGVVRVRLGLGVGVRVCVVAMCGRVGGGAGGGGGKRGGGERGEGGWVRGGGRRAEDVRCTRGGVSWAKERQSAGEVWR